MRYLTLILLIFLTSCEYGADLDNQRKYSNKEISFSYPGNWQVTEDSESEGARYIFIESPGEAIMTIEIYDHEDSYDLYNFVQLERQLLLNEFPKLVQIDAPDVIKITEKTIAGEKMVGLSYEINMSIIGVDVPHVTEVFEISNAKKSAFLSAQVATEDRHLVSDGFDLILSSFKHEDSITNNSSGTLQRSP